MLVGANPMHHSYRPEARESKPVAQAETIHPPPASSDSSRSPPPPPTSVSPALDRPASAQSTPPALSAAPLDSIGSRSSLHPSPESSPGSASPHPALLQRDSDPPAG